MLANCTRCGTGPRSLHRHHKTPRSLGGTDDPNNLEYLCANCHEDEHGGVYGGSLGNKLAHTPQAKAKRSATFKRLWTDPAYREKVLASRVKANTPEVNSKRVTAMHRWYKENPGLVVERNKKIAESRSRKGLKPGQRNGETDEQWKERIVRPRLPKFIEMAARIGRARAGTTLDVKHKTAISDGLKRAYVEGRRKPPE